MRVRYFGSIVNETVILSSRDLRNLFKVRRLKVGDEFELAARGSVYLCRLSSKKPFGATVLHEINENHELNNFVRLIVSVQDIENLKKIFYEAPFYGVHSIALYDPRYGKKGKFKLTPRYNDDLLEAIDDGSMESKRGFLPKFEGVFPLSEVIKDDSDVRILIELTKSGDTSALFNALKNINKKSKVTLFISPIEGIEKESDLTILHKCDYNNVTLSKRLLSSPIASSYALAILASVIEKK